MSSTPNTYQLWAPDAEQVRMRLREPGAERTEELDLERGSDGWFRLLGRSALPGARYAFRIDDQDPWVPDPRSRFQPEGVHGPSEVVDPLALRSASAPAWPGRELRGAVIYELHVGTFTAGPDGTGGTFDTAIERLEDLAALGIDAVEIMPVAAFPGDRGWGYDGVDLFAVHAAYGGPAAFVRFIEAAHARGIAVILDVVYNHLGPAGNYLGMIGPYFTDKHHTPWGQAVNLDDTGAEGVRAFILANAHQWLVDYQLDGLRLDAVHELRDDSGRHLLAELSDAVADWSRETGRPLTLIAESDLNDVRIVTPTAHGGYGMDMQWADDIHHAVHAWISGERQGYYVDFGSDQVLRRTMTGMFEHTGTFSTFRDRPWGAPVDPDSEDYDAHSFVAFLEDHDQVGNRAIGDRVHQLLSPTEHAAAAALILLGAATPMLFQGEEWATAVPFTFFTDHDEELGPLVTAGRTAEFAAMGWDAEQVPDPQDPATFRSSFLDWDIRDREPNARMLDWYRTLIALRHAEADLRDADLHHISLELLEHDAVVLRRGSIAALISDAEHAVRTALPHTEVLASFGTVLEAQDDAEQLGLDGPGAIVVRLPEGSGQG